MGAIICCEEFVLFQIRIPLLLPDSHTPLLLAAAPSTDSSLPENVTVAAKSFSKPKPKPGLWNLAKAEPRQQQQQQQQQQSSSETIVETPTPSIKVTEPSFDSNANAEEKSIASSGNTKGHSIQFADLVMSTLPSQVRRLHDLVSSGRFLQLDGRNERRM